MTPKGSNNQIAAEGLEVRNEGVFKVISKLPGTPER
jgi:hypothetical protein